MKKDIFGWPDLSDLGDKLHRTRPGKPLVFSDNTELKDAEYEREHEYWKNRKCLTEEEINARSKDT